MSAVPMPPVQSAEVNGIRMAYYEAGPNTAKPPVVLCHGWPELAYSWRHQIRDLAAAGIRVIAPDQRGYGRTHPFAGEIRFGTIEVCFIPEELGFPVVIGEISLTECEMINQFKGSAGVKPQFTRGYEDLGARFYGTKGVVDAHYRAIDWGHGPVTITGDNAWPGTDFDNTWDIGVDNNCKDFVASIRSGRFINHADYAAESTLTSILGRQAAAGGATAVYGRRRAQTWRTPAARDTGSSRARNAVSASSASPFCRASSA